MKDVAPSNFTGTLTFKILNKKHGQLDPDLCPLDRDCPSYPLQIAAVILCVAFFDVALCRNVAQKCQLSRDKVCIK